MSDDVPIRLVLSMIVKNESRIIERCLESALPFIQALVIEDTGSTDDTIPKILKFQKKHDLPGLLFSAPWKNFGHNRTIAASRARDWVEERGWPLARTYLLMLDADMTLHARGLFDAATLTWPWYTLKQHGGGMEWDNTRLCRLSHDWKSLGVTHEYWSPTPNCPPLPLPHLFINDHGDGGSKGDKTTRDIELLTAGLAEDPQNVRYMFYLAQSYFDSGKFEEAIRLYTMRFAHGGWDEECWYSLYRLGKCFFALKQDEPAAATLLRAYEYRPFRAEALVELARHYRLAGKSNLAFLYARRASELPPSGDTLFVDTNAYRHEPLYELSISGFYAHGGRELGARAAEKLVTMRGAPVDYDHVACNQTFYLEEFPALAKGTFPVPPGLDEKYGMPYVATNPTITPGQRTEEELLVHLRLVNYTQRNGRYYDPHGGTFLTRGAVLKADFLGDRLDVTSQPIEIEEPLPDDWELTRIQGLEDKRWVRYKGNLWFTATSCQTPGSGGWPRVVLGKMSQDLSRVEHVTPLDYGQKKLGEREKNWVPWVVGDELRLIYSYDPFVVVRAEPTGACTEVCRHVPPRRLTRFKGSASPVPLTGSQSLMSVHETAYMPTTATWEYSIYSHRWLLLERGLPTGCSRPWYFDHRGVEYSTGLARVNDRLIATYGVEDRQARWAIFDLETVLGSIDRW